MTWEEALERQRYLQTKLFEEQNIRPSMDDLLVAAKVELGELMQEAKPYWAWWKRHDRPEQAVDKRRLVEEAADVLHFLLGAALEDDHAPNFVANTFPRSEAFNLPLSMAADWLYEAAEPREAFIAFNAVLRALGIAHDELLAAYDEKSRINLERWGVTPNMT